MSCQMKSQNLNMEMNSFKNRNWIKGLLFSLCLLLSLGNSFAQFEIPPVPSSQTSVYDYGKMMSTREVAALKNKLIQYSDQTSTQIVVITIDDLNGDEINRVGAEWAHKWGIGQKGKDNGIVVLVSKNDRKMAIQTGYGIEHLLTDALSRRVIENDIKPYFKTGNYYAGLDAGTNSIFSILKGEYKASKKRSRKTGRRSKPVAYLLGFVALMYLFSRRGGGGGGHTMYHGGTLHRGGGWMSGGSSGGFGGSSGGFGGGFGGGGFGGGGASGSW